MADLGNIASTALGVAKTVANVAGALNNLSNPASLVSAIRGISLPSGGNVTGIRTSAGAQFVTTAENDWRVRLSIPTTTVFTSSPILKPLINAGGLVFPYTPTITISHTAAYSEEPITHQNYSFIYYQNSKADTIQINGAFHVEDAVQAQYWIAAVHYLRGVTKMFSGSDEGALAGNPPPIVYLNGYGDYVFKNIPVVVRSFSIDLPSDVNYISTSMSSLPSSAQTLENATNLSTQFPFTGNINASLISQLVNSGEGLVANLVNTTSTGVGSNSNITASMQGPTHVPVKSTLSVQCQPIYSRENIRKFNLKDFVHGNLLNNIPGFI